MSPGASTTVVTALKGKAAAGSPCLSRMGHAGHGQLSENRKRYLFRAPPACQAGGSGGRLVATPAAARTATASSWRPALPAPSRQLHGCRRHATRYTAATLSPLLQHHGARPPPSTPAAAHSSSSLGSGSAVPPFNSRGGSPVPPVLLIPGLYCPQDLLQLADDAVQECMALQFGALLAADAGLIGEATMRGRGWGSEGQVVS